MNDDTSTPTRGDSYCPSCGSRQVDAGTYCTDCGKPLAGPRHRQWRRTWTGAIIASVTAFAILTASIVVLAIGGGGDAAETGSSGMSTTSSSTTSAAPTTMLVVPEFNEKALADSFGDAVFKVTTDGCELDGTGSGFAIDEHHIVTNRHVVANDTTPTVTGRDGSVREGSVIGWREDPDVAVIWVEDTLTTYLEWADSDELSEGERTLSLGYPLPDHDFSVAPGVVLSFDDVRGHRDAIRSDAQLDMGNSGGPTLLADGSVAGVVTAMDLNLTGYQFVPIIQPANDMAEKVAWIVDNPARPTVDCDEVVAALESEVPATTTTIAPPPPPPPPPPPAAAPESFYTVIMASLQQHNASFDFAMNRAQQLADEYGVTMYVLDSNGYSSLRPGYWVVHVGKMSRADAKEIAAMLQSWGYDYYAQKVSG